MHPFGAHAKRGVDDIKAGKRAYPRELVSEATRTSIRKQVIAKLNRKCQSKGTLSCDNLLLSGRFHRFEALGFDQNIGERFHRAAPVCSS